MKWKAYTDGACAPSNPGPAGWGVVVIAPDGTLVASSGLFESAVFVEEIAQRDSTTLAARLGAGALLAVVVPGPARRRSRGEAA